jgi:ubiquitin C-terminal hydrolase
MLKFPQSHHKSDQACTLEELISHHNGPEDIHEYWCNSCNMLTFARRHSIISQYPEVLCIVLDCKKTNDTIMKLVVKYHLHGLQPSQCVQEHQDNVGLQYDLIGTVHHTVNRGKSGHYIAVCQHQDSNGWFTYDDEPRGALPGLGWYGSMYKFLLVTNLGGH